MSNKSFMDVLKNRRTIYTLSKETTIPNEKIEEIIKDAVRHVPSAFNNQSARVMILYGENHKKLWEIVMNTLHKVVPAGNFETTENKIKGLANSYGTVLFFDSTRTTKELMEKFPLYRDNFPVWAEQSNGMLQFAIWALLEEQGLGASLQHYNPLIDDEVKDVFGIPKSWKLIAQMPFGKPTAPATGKEFLPIEKRVIIL
ncbi:nitroreductase family protein [Fusobacterium ulcerans]|uniref:nitroreductase family protein n=1 Tax=Fusobacterium ulcerans TaxID=861 RepID=UPI001D0B235B|nr:nitroreductase family protein [Fusobacterium ulcerans]MCB8566050.1 nitroreductase family protein [Fusobacterium ulcerans]MCB8650057.1 nitroreductase family protein [Fusobacterium ulcerans]